MHASRPAQNLRQRAQQHAQPFVGIKRADEAQHQRALQPELPLEFQVGRAAHQNSSMSTALGITVTFSAGIPRATMSLRNPSQIVVTASARLRAQVSSPRLRR